MLSYAGYMGVHADQAIRDRLSAWTRWLLEEYGLTQAQMAERMGVKQPTISQALNKRKGIGLDFLVKLHNAFHKSADTFIDADPPKRDGGSQTPSQASPVAASPKRRSTGGGHG